MLSSTPIIGPLIRDLWHFTKQETAFQRHTQRTGQHTRICTTLHTRLPTHRLKLHFTPATYIIKQVSPILLRLQYYYAKLWK